MLPCSRRSFISQLRRDRRAKCHGDGDEADGKILDQKIEDFSGGELQISINNEHASNIVLWQGLTEEAVDALEELRQAKKIASRIWRPPKDRGNA